MIIPMAAAACAAGGVEMRFATAYAPDNYQTQNLQRYADELARATGNRLVVKVHPAGTLLKPAEIFSGVRQGRADGGEVIMSSLANEIPLFGIDSLPFIVSGYADARRMWEISRGAVEKALAERGLKLLYAVPWPPQNLYSNRPIKGTYEFKGLRMRSYNPASERIAQLAGAIPVPIQVIDLHQAIADDKFDLMLTSSWTGVEVQAWTRLKYYYKVNAWIPKNVVFVRQAIFEKLEPEVRRSMLELAQAAEERGWRLSQESDQDYERQLAANNVNVQQLDPLARRALDRIGEALAREWLKKAGNEDWKVLLQYTTDRSMQ